MSEKMFFADALGFLGNRGGKITVEDGLQLNLVHLTAVPPWITTMKETLTEIEKFKKMILEQPRLKLVMNQKELSMAVADKKVAVILGMQNTPVDIIEDGSVLELRKSGISIISPCYDKKNDLGSGWLNADIGLTTEAVTFLNDCGKEGVIVDISHSGHKTARDIVSYIASHNRAVPYLPYRVVASHTGCYSQYHHIRNLPDDVLKDVAEAGGVIGVTTLTFTNDECDNSVFSFKNHVTRIMSLCGENSVCVGSDDVYVTRDIEGSKKQFEIMSKKLDPLGTQGSRFPENPVSIMGPNMMEKLYKFCLPYFAVGLSEKIFGQNLLNFFKRALPAS